MTTMTVRCRETVAVLLSLSPLLDMAAAAAIPASLQPQLRRLGLDDGEPSCRKRPRYGGRGGEDPDIRGVMGGPKAATKNSSEDEGDVGEGEVEGTPTLPSSPMPEPGCSSQGDLGDTPTTPTLHPLPGPGSSSQGDLGETPTTPRLQPFFPSQASQGGANGTAVGGRSGQQGALWQPCPLPSPVPSTTSPARPQRIPCGMPRGRT